MLVMLSCGNSSDRIISTISKQIDNVDFCYLSNVQEFINQSKLRHFAFDRLVFTQKFISTDEDMGKLCDYIRENLSSAEIVMMIQSQGDDEIEKLFLKYFDSPMYTLMCVDKPTTKCLVDAVKLTIPDVRARYYSLDKGSDSKNDNKSKIGLFKGGKKNKSDNKKNSNSDLEDYKSKENIGDIASSKTTDENNLNIVDNTVNSVVSTEINNCGIEDANEKVEIGEDTSVSLGDENLNNENLSSISDDMDLSIGEYGSVHSDSGFVGDDDIEELKNYAKSNDVKPVKDNTEVKSSVNVQEEIEHTAPKTEITDVVTNNNIDKGNLSSDEVLCYNKVNIITGLVGSGATAFVVNKAVEAVNIGKRVLIIDLDVVSNGILSFIDVNSFYAKGFNGGIDGRMRYSEDGVDILSNGYGMGINTSLDELLSQPILRNYDLILVDCPINCLNLISDKCFVSCNVVMCCISDVSKVLETSMMLYNRDYVSLSKEEYISKYCKVANKNISNEDISLVKNNVLFTNGCWLTNR